NVSVAANPTVDYLPISIKNADGSHSVVETGGLEESGFDYIMTRLLNVSPIAVLHNRRQTFGEGPPVVELRLDNNATGFINESSSAGLLTRTKGNILGETGRGYYENNHGGQDNRFHSYLRAE